MSPAIQDHPGLEHIERLLAGGAPSPLAADLLDSIGVIDPARACRNLQSLALHPAFPRGDRAFLVQLLAALGETFEPERALSNLERIIESREDPDALLRTLRRYPGRRSALLTLAGGSQFLSDTVLRHPDFLDWLLRPATLRSQRSVAQMASEAWRWVKAAWGGPHGPANALRRFRQQEYLRIGLCDLMRLADMPTTTRSLSRLADACLETALRIARAELEPQHGRPRWRGEDGRWRPCEFAVIGLGKLGGLELNFSSDIDLLFLYSSDEGGTPGGAGSRDRGKLSNHEYHVRLARRAIALMAENTEEGHVFRVDTRLRPEGDQGALVYSLRSCEVYYESWGQTWERQALIKARAVAGSPALGQAFLDMIRPFIYRRTRDLSALDEIGHIKDRINAHIQAAGRGAHNVKLGEGGIREIEFIAQSFQLIYGGRESHLRTPQTLEALSAIRALGLLPMADCEGLAAAYIFLRDVEHRVQVTHGLQTHELPADPHSLTVLARKMGFQREGGRNERETFLEALRNHQELVSRVFQNLFRKEDAGEAAQRPRPEEGPAAAAETLEDSLSPADLAPYDFADPVAASAQLRLLRNGEPFQHVSARAKRLFDELIPRVLYLTLDMPDPDRAVVNLNRFVEKGGGREAVFTLLAEQENILGVLLRLFASSDYLSDILLAQPGLLDPLFRTEALTASKDAGTLAAELAADALRASSAAQRFVRLCAAKRGEELAIGLRSLLGEADILQTLRDLTALAEAVVAAGHRIAYEELVSLHGTPIEEETGAPAGFSVIGMGKLGSREMNFGSDLDLVFLYSRPGATDGRAGEHPAKRGSISNHEFFLRLATALRDGLAAPEAGGRAYEIDLRLRPEGQKGALAAPLEAFESYFRERAETWERQALCRARPVAGSPELSRRFMELAAEFVYERPLPPDLAGEVDHVRLRMERELTREAEGEIDLKLGHGGITDIEFLVQFLLISHGKEHPSIRRPETVAALEALRDAGLLESADAEALLGAYRFLRQVENRLRIAHARPLHTFPSTPEGIGMLARRLSYADDEGGSARAKLLADYERLTRQVRDIYRKVLGLKSQP
ncbi:MAG: bifunctional [glutamate--ammonia ligase]-adenylyl-L-tyrosine phosphorylase/[glutamate--ammonia-ligase] adenylyltransferase [Nitrospinota bacterium]